MKLKIYIVLFLCLSLAVPAQHNGNYSQYMFNGLLLNPAYAGSNDALNLTALYRKQWLGLDGSPTTITFSAHSPMRNKKISLGAVAMDDKFGVSEHARASFVYAYRFSLGVGALSLGLSGGLDIYQANWGQVRTTQLRDPSFPAAAERKILPQAGFGMYYHTGSFYTGLSVPSLINKSQMPYETAVFTSGCVLPLADNFRIKPSVLLKYILHSPVDVNLSATCYWQNIIGLGLGYTVNGAAMAYMDLKVTDQLRAGYAYDYTFSRLRNYSTGSHEVMLRYLFNYKVNVSSARYF